MGTKLKAIYRIIKSRKFVLLTVPRNSLLIKVDKGGPDNLSTNVLIMTKILGVYEDTKQKVTEQAAEAGQVRNLQAITDAVKALEESSDVRE